VQPPLRLVLVMPAGTELPELPHQVVLVHDEGPQLRADYCIERPVCLLVRPDGHIAAAVDGTRGSDLHSALARCARATGGASINTASIDPANATS